MDTNIIQIKRRGKVANKRVLYGVILPVAILYVPVGMWLLSFRSRNSAWLTGILLLMMFGVAIFIERYLNTHSTIVNSSIEICETMLIYRENTINGESLYNIVSIDKIKESKEGYDIYGDIRVVRGSQIITAGLCMINGVKTDELRQCLTEFKNNVSSRI